MATQPLPWLSGHHPFQPPPEPPGSEPQERVESAALPDCLAVTAWTADEHGEVDEIMGLRHREWDIEGVQFHPEAILSEQGHALLKNFLER